MTISVVIPTYNRKTHIFRAINSVLAQTVPVREIIVVDDGSVDGTAEAVAGCYDSRVRVFRQENAGVAAARNRGIREAQSEWIAFLDSDDSWLPTKTQRQLEALDTLSGEFGVCFTDNVFDGRPDLKQSMFQTVGFDGAPVFGTLDEPTQYIVDAREPFFTSSLLVKSSVLKEVDGFDDALVFGEDTDLFFRLSFRTRFCFVREPLVRIDREPSRSALCDVCSTRGDLKYDSLERWFGKWLAMPEVIGTKYEAPIRETLRLVYYSSVEAKLHDFRFKPAFRKLSRLNALGHSYPLIIQSLLKRKLKKLGVGANVPRKQIGWQW